MNEFCSTADERHSLRCCCLPLLCHWVTGLGLLPALVWDAAQTHTDRQTDRERIWEGKGRPHHVGSCTWHRTYSPCTAMRSSGWLESFLESGPNTSDVLYTSHTQHSNTFKHSNISNCSKKNALKCTVSAKVVVWAASGNWRPGSVWHCLLHLVPAILHLWFTCDTRRCINLFWLIDWNSGF